MSDSRRSREKVILILLSGFLMLAAFAMLFFLKRLPLPARLAIGVVDLIAASALLLFLRQNYSDPK